MLYSRITKWATRRQAPVVLTRVPVRKMETAEFQKARLFSRVHETNKVVTLQT
jgi:hypothetical protein